MTDEISKAVESANKNLDNALEEAVEKLHFISAMKHRFCVDDTYEIAKDCIKIADDAIEKIAAILKVKQKDK